MNQDRALLTGLHYWTGRDQNTTCIMRTVWKANTGRFCDHEVYMYLLKCLLMVFFDYQNTYKMQFEIFINPL